jgi:hypothetical protein
MTTQQRMRTRTRVLIAGGALVVVVGAGAGIGIAASGDEDQHPDTPITGGALDRAKAAALRHTGGGRVTETEVGDEESYYEVEVTLDDGRQIDVQLDESFQVVGGETDHEDGSGGDD